jgi:hypothetical protein
MKFNSADFTGLTKMAEVNPYLEKSAVWSETGWGQRNPGKAMVADLATYMIPGVGTVASGVDAFRDFKNGKILSGLGNLGIGALSLLPFGGALKGLGKGIGKALGAVGMAGKGTKVVNALNTAGNAFNKTLFGRFNRLANVGGAGKVLPELAKSNISPELARTARLAKWGRRGLTAGSIGAVVAGGAGPTPDQYRQHAVNTFSQYGSNPYQNRSMPSTPSIPSYSTYGGRW